MFGTQQRKIHNACIQSKITSHVKKWKHMTGNEMAKNTTSPHLTTHATPT